MDWVFCMHIVTKIHPYIEKAFWLQNRISKTRDKLEENLREIERLKTFFLRITVKMTKSSAQKAQGNPQRNQSINNVSFSFYKKKTTF